MSRDKAKSAEAAEVVIVDQDTPEEPAPEVSAPARKTVRLRTREAHRRLVTAHGTITPTFAEFSASDAEEIQAAAQRSGVPLIVSDDH